MALIGSIAINMVVKTAGMRVQLGQASKALEQFGSVGSSAVGLLQSGFGMVTNAIGSVLDGLMGLVKTAALAGAGLVALAAVAIKGCVEKAMALGEQSDRARVVFGAFADDVIKQAELMNTAFGVSKTQFIQTASALGSIFKGAGYSTGDAAKLSIHFSKLATDLASLVHIPVEEAMNKIQSGLVGMARPLREVGVMMNEEAVASEAARMGIARMGTELSESQKMQARISLITKSLADAQGNLALTSGSAANSLKGMQGRIDDLMASIGTAMLPIVVKALEGFQQGIEALKLAWEQSSLAANAATSGVIGNAGQQVETISWLQKAVDFVADAWDSVKLRGLDAMHSLVQAALAAVRTMGTAGSFMGPFIGIASRDIQKMSLDAQDALGNVLRDVDKIRAAEAAKPPTRNTVDQFFGQAKDKIQEARDELAKQPALDLNSIKPNASDALKGTGQTQNASAMAMNSKEATNTILRSSFSQRGGAQEQTAVNTRETVTVLKQIHGLFANSKRATHTPEDLQLIEI